MKKRIWDARKFNADTARQEEIEVGDIVRSFDFPGIVDSDFIEGVVTAKDLDGFVITIHITRDVFGGDDMQVGARLVADAPLGVNSRNVPGVYLIAKRKAQS